MIKLIDVINSSVGRNEKKEPNCAISISEQLLNDNGVVKPIKEYILTKPEVKVVLNGDYVMFDARFASPSEPELRILWNYLESFGKSQNKHYETEQSPILNFIVLPHQYSGKHCYTLFNPICWTLQPSTPIGANDTIRLLFEKASLNLYSGEDVNDKEIEEEIRRENEESRRLEEIERQKELEHEEYLDKLNSRFNSGAQ